MNSKDVEIEVGQVVLMHGYYVLSVTHSTSAFIHPYTGNRYGVVEEILTNLTSTVPNKKLFQVISFNKKSILDLYRDEIEPITDETEVALLSLALI